MSSTTPILLRKGALSLPASSPSTSARPASGRFIPSSRLMRVDFPAPFSPISPITQPVGRARSIGPSVKFLNDFVKPSILIASAMAGTS